MPLPLFCPVSVPALRCWRPPGLSHRLSSLCPGFPVLQSCCEAVCHPAVSCLPGLSFETPAGVSGIFFLLGRAQVHPLFGWLWASGSFPRNY